MSDANHKTSDEIREDIERTRNEMSEKIDTIQDRLNPEQLKNQAQTVVQDAVKEGTDTLVDFFNTNAQQITGTVIDAVKRNPIPAALIGLGVGWLIVNTVTSSDNDNGIGKYRERRRLDRKAGIEYGAYDEGTYVDMPYEYDDDDWRQMKASYDRLDPESDAEEESGTVSKVVEKARDAVQNAAGRVGEQASHLAKPITHAGSQADELRRQAQHRAKSMGGKVQRSMEDSPLAFGAAALMIGMSIGLALPSTRRENQLLGEMRDRVVSNTQDLASNVAQEVQQTAAEVVPKLQETAKRAVDDVKQVGKEAGQEMKENLKDAGDSLSLKAEEIQADQTKDI